MELVEELGHDDGEDLLVVQATSERAEEAALGVFWFRARAAEVALDRDFSAV